MAVVIPALNEAPAIGKVLNALPHWLDTIVVADNGSTDGTVAIAVDHGAVVVDEPRRGYGRACLAGVASVPRDTDILVFLDADFSDVPEQMDRLVDPVLNGEADMVLGSRQPVGGKLSALTLQQRIGNGLACALIRLIWGHRYEDLGPFRAIRYKSYAALGMTDKNYGWTIEMQIKAIEQGVEICEVPVSYRARIGQSKISGTFRGVVSAGMKILTVIGIHALRKFGKTVRRGAMTNILSDNGSATPLRDEAGMR